MLQQIPHEDVMLYLPLSQHELGNTDMPQSVNKWVKLKHP